MSQKMRRTKLENRFDLALVVFVILLMSVLVTVASIDLREKQQAYIVEKAELERELEEQAERKQQLQEFEQYVKTDAYVEEVAQDELGLVHENEILFKLQR